MSNAEVEVQKERKKGQKGVGGVDEVLVLNNVEVEVQKTTTTTTRTEGSGWGG